MGIEELSRSRGSGLYEHLLRHVQSVTEAVGSGDRIYISDTQAVAAMVIGDFASSRDLLAAAMIYHDPLDFAVSHAANVAIYSLKMATDMGLGEEEVADTVTAGLLHDVGFSRVPAFERGVDELALYEDDPLQAFSEQDRQEVGRHPGYGYEAIVLDSPRAERIAEIVLQHHEKADGSGYPNGLKESEQHVQARILSIIDTYEALIHPRPYRDALVPPRGMESIMQQERGTYSSGMIQELLRSFSLYPVGHCVELSDSSIARVVETHSDNPVRPAVEVVVDFQGKRLESPKRIDLREQQVLSIRRCLPRYQEE